MKTFKQSIFFLTTAEDQTNCFFGEVRRPKSSTFVVGNSSFYPGLYRVANDGIQRVGARPGTDDFPNPTETIEEADRSLAALKKNVEELLSAMLRADVLRRSSGYLDSCGHVAETIRCEPLASSEIGEWSRRLSDDLSRFLD